MATLTTPGFQQQQALMPLPPELSQGFVDIDETLVFNYVLQPGQEANALQQPISGDGDYWLCGWQMTSVLFQRPDLVELAGNAGARLSDDTGYRLQSDYVNVAFLTPIAGNSFPRVIRPAHLFKAGTRINIDLQELSNVTDTGLPVPNVIQIAFRGRYRYRMSDVQLQSQLIAKSQRFKRGDRQ